MRDSKSKAAGVISGGPMKVDAYPAAARQRGRAAT